jgi:uncharacterized repeat protein (TIGR01451 family)
MSPIDLERLLADCSPDRRSFLRTLVLGTAYAAPIVASFSLDGLVADAAAQAELCTSNLFSNVADLVITKTATPEPVVAGTELVYTLTVHNCGPLAAENVSFTDQLPSGATFVSAAQDSTTPTPTFALTTPAVGDEGGVVSGAALAPLPSGTSVRFEIVVQVNP